MSIRHQYILPIWVESLMHVSLLIHYTYIYTKAVCINVQNKECDVDKSMIQKNKQDSHADTIFELYKMLASMWQYGWWKVERTELKHLLEHNKHIYYSFVLSSQTCSGRTANKMLYINMYTDMYKYKTK